MHKRKKKKKILIAEDEPFLLELYKARFEQDGFDVVVALNGATVITQLKEEKPDILLLDIIMPEVDGYEVLQKIQKDDSLPDIPILIFSNLAQDEEIQKGLLLGADDYFIKSNFTPSQIVRKINQLISAHSKNDTN